MMLCIFTTFTIIILSFQIERHIRESVEQGAKVVHGGKRHKLGGNYFEPTVLTDVTSEMPVSQEETFGPVAPLLK